jgi:hypothetical protein
LIALAEDLEEEELEMRKGKHSEGDESEMMIPMVGWISMRICQRQNRVS